LLVGGPGCHTPHCPHTCPRVFLRTAAPIQTLGPISPPYPSSPPVSQARPSLLCPSRVNLICSSPFRRSFLIPIPALELVSLRPLASQTRAVTSSFSCPPFSSALHLLSGWPPSSIKRHLKNFFLPFF
jgi:hypothetical protein